MVNVVLDENIPITKIEGTELEIISQYKDKFKEILEKYSRKILTSTTICEIEDRMFTILEGDFNNGKLPYNIYPDIELDTDTNKISLNFYRRTQYSVSTMSPLALYELNSTLGDVETIDDMASGIQDFCKRNKVPLDDLITKLEKLKYEDRLTDKAIRLSINVLNVFNEEDKKN